MIELVIGWIKDTFFTSVEEIKPAKITPSRAGYNFEHKELKRLMLRLRDFQTVDFTDISGNLLVPETIDQRFGRDGGIDCVIHIVAPTERGARNVAGRIRNILTKGNY